MNAAEQWRAETATFMTRGEVSPPVETNMAPYDPDLVETPVNWPARLAAVALAIGALAWIGLVGWRAALALQAGMPSISAILAGIATLSAPLALIGVGWLLLRRTSRREALRFGETAAAMRAEAAALEQLLATLSTRIEENRRALSDHAHQLVLLGDDSAARLAGISGAMRDETAELARQTGTLEHAARGARADLDILLQDLPRATSESREMAALLREAGSDAQAQAGALETAIVTLAERGRETEQVVGGAARALSADVTRLESASVAAGVRIESTAGQMSASVDAALADAARAVDEARRAIDTQNAAMIAMIENGRAALDRTGDDATRILAERLDQLDQRIERMTEQLGRSDAVGSGLVGTLDAGLANIEQRVELLGQSGAEKTAALGAAFATLGGQADAIDGALGRGTQSADALIARTQTLVDLLRQNGVEIGEALPQALAELERRIDESRAALGALVPQAARLAGSASDATAALGSADALLLRQGAAIRELGLAAEERLTTIQEQADRVTAAISDSGAQARQLVDSAAPQLIDALLRVRETAAQAADHAREALSAVIPEAANALGQAAHGALEKAVDAQIQAQMAEVRSAGEQAVEATHRATERLMRQLLTIADTTGTIETRIAETRAEADRADEDSLSRRVAVLIDAMNSTAIDVAGVLSQDISDSAWAGYLRGDRGIFTRRTVRLLDGTQVRQIQRLYGRDPAFHDQLNRYVHDFEAMLRRVLASRDGSSLAITLLSSDVGKLYVALAQAIDRLRT